MSASKSFLSDPRYGYDVVVAVTQDSIKGALPVGNLTLTPDLAEVRWDDPVAHTQSDKGEAFLIITGKVKNNSPDAVYRTSTRVTRQTMSSISIRVSDGAPPNKSYTPHELSVEIGPQVGLTPMPQRTFG